MKGNEYIEHLESSTVFMSDDLRSRLGSSQQALSIDMLITNSTGTKLQIHDVKKVKCNADSLEICALMPPAAINKILQVYQESNNITYGSISHDNVLCREYSIEHLSTSAMIVTLLFSK
ncbi:MAG: hypothetical protein H8E12_10555 [Rhodobacteraceae bacterium]|nr:hypothetical protein [Paracoccaceae bacterium]